MRFNAAFGAALTASLAIVSIHPTSAAEATTRLTATADVVPGTGLDAPMMRRGQPRFIAVPPPELDGHGSAEDRAAELFDWIERLEANSPLPATDVIAEIPVEADRAYLAYLKAMIVLHEVDLLWGHLGIPGVATLETMRGRTVQESYDESLALLDDIRRISETTGIEVSDNVAPRSPSRGDAEFVDIIDVLDAALAELIVCRSTICCDSPPGFDLPVYVDRLPVNLHEVLVLTRHMAQAVASGV